MGLFGWWTTRSELETLGRQLSEMFAKRVPVARVDDANLVGREIGIIASHAVGIRRKKGLGVFGQAKLANILFTRELARRLKGTGVTANTLHPGFVATRFADNSRGLFARIVSVAKNFALTPEQGAETLVYLASSPEVAGITTADYPLPAVRPAYGLLDSQKLANWLGQDWPNWQQGVDRVLARLHQQTVSAN